MSTLNLLRDAGVTQKQFNDKMAELGLALIPGDWLRFDTYEEFIEASNGEHQMKTLTFDTETTGVDTTTDRVIELCIMGDDHKPHTWRFKPPIPISEEAQEVHGILMEDLKDCPSFDEMAEYIYDNFKEADVLIGYNVGFDISMIMEEFERCGMSLDMTGKLIVDPLKLWYHQEQRTLEAAYERFMDNPMEGAHAAEADVKASKEVLIAMVEEWDLSEMGWPELADLCEPDRHKFVGISPHFLWDDDGKVIFGFGKHKGERAASNIGYLQWMLKGTFPSSVKNSIRAMLDGSLKR